MTKDTLEKSIDFINKVKTNHKEIKIVFHGGEPLTAGYDWFKHALETLSSALNNRVSYSIQSNLWDIDELFIDLFAQYRVNISASLDGYREVCDEQRGTGYFDKIMTALNKLRENGISTSIIATIVPENINKIPKIIAFFESEHLPFTMRGAVPSIEHGYTCPDCFITSKDNEAIYNLMFNYIENSPSPMRIRDIEAAVSAVFHKNSDLCLFSNCLGQYAAISPDGGVYACQRFCGIDEFKLGTVYDNLKTLENSAAYKLMTSKHENIKANCGECKHFEYCNGGCLYSAFTAEKYKQPLLFCNDSEQSQNFYKRLFNNISIKLALEETNVMLGVECETPYLSVVGNRPHKGQIEQSKREFIKAAEWSTDGAPRHAFSQRDRANTVFLNITANCPLNCGHCSVQASSGNRDMPLEKIISIIKDADKIGFKEISINGGEPFIYEDFTGLIEEIKKLRNLNMLYTLFTSLYLDFDNETGESILCAFDRITVSLDGNEEEHDQRRSSGGFARTCKNIEKLISIKKKIKASCEVNVRATLSHTQREHGLGKIVKEIAFDLGVDAVTVENILPIGRAKTLEEPCLRKPKTSQEQFFLKPFKPRYSCGLGSNLHITPNGDIYPCWAFIENGKPIGNVKNGFIKEVCPYVWGNEADRYCVSQVEKCRDCSVKYLCGGVCHGYNETDCDELKEYYLSLLNTLNE